MTDSINQRINKEVYRDVNFIKRWIFLTKKERYNFSETIDYVFQEFIKKHDIIKETDISEQHVKKYDNILKENRVDTNMPVDLRDDIKIIQYVMNKDKDKEEKKITMDQVIRTIVDKYMELYPEIKHIKNQDKYIIQRIGLEEARKKKYGY